MACLPAANAERVEGKGLSPICNSMTSLPRAFNCLATANTSKAVSDLSVSVKRLKRMGAAVAFMAVGSRGLWQ
jgi:hypothetical protein